MTSATRSWLKRFLDVTIAAFLLVITLPISGIATIAIWLSMGRPALFKQMRPGLNCEPFVLLKFRTMTGQSIPGREALDEGERLTSLGRSLRRTSIDEIPQLINVLRGNMSLVGPRPLLMEYLSLYSREQLRRHRVKPGITGWTQVRGRNSLGWNEKFALDVWYVDNWSIALDFKILGLTIRQVLLGTGVNTRENVTMPRFRGNQPRGASAVDNTSAEPCDVNVGS